MAKSQRKKTGKPSGFSEAPQAALEGEPLKGSVTDWADEITREADGEIPLSAPSGRLPRKGGEGSRRSADIPG